MNGLATPSATRCGREPVTGNNAAKAWTTMGQCALAFKMDSHSLSMLERASCV